MINNIINIAKSFNILGIKTYFVGGIVRDNLLNINTHDIDICLVNVVDKKQVIKTLSSFSFVSSITEEVGGNFPVWIADIEGIGKVDFALARGEKKNGPNRQDFICDINNITIEQDLLRRDLTINAIAKNVLTGEIIDPYGGVQDLENRIAREVSPAFAEDPLRVLRAARFISRFNLKPTGSLIDICENLSCENIPAERFGMELFKAMKQASKPSKFFNFLLHVGWLEDIFPELRYLINVPQDKKHHPEGDAYLHTMHCIDAADDYFTRLVMLCHDLGKATTTTISDNGKVQAIGHEQASVPLADSMLSRVMLESAPGFGGRKEIDKILVLVRLHMLHTCKSIKDKKLAHKVNILHESNLTFKDLVKVMKADESGRPPLVPDFTFINNMDSRVDGMIANDRFVPIVNATMLMERGIEPSPKLGQLIKEAFKLQLSGGLTKNNWFKVLNLK